VYLGPLCALGGALLLFKPSEARSTELAPIRTPSNVQVNRALPSFTPIGSPHTIPDEPSDAEIGLLPLFAERIVPVELKTLASARDRLKGLFSKGTVAPAVENNRLIADTLRELQVSNSPYETTALAAFIKAHPRLGGPRRCAMKWRGDNFSKAGSMRRSPGGTSCGMN
jgi:hypothetical protein